MKNPILLSLIVLLLIFWQKAFAEGTLPLPQTPQPPRIDGVLDDAVWQQAAVFTDFKTLKPDFGLPPSEKSEALLAYDRENLYFAIRCYDSEPAKVKATLSARDQDNGDDWVGFCLDADNDEMASFFFLSNPLGIQMDGTLDAAASPDAMLDLVWQSAGKRTPDGYVIEMAIPFRNLRFPKKETLTMGFKIARYISRKSEEVDFPEYRPERGAALTQFQKITVTGVRGGRVLEVLPSFTLSKNDRHEAGEMQGGDWKPAFGATAKIGITSGLTLDATYNPDFSQVETDASQVDVNLRSALFYPEKRPFFQEGQEWFGFSARPDGTFLREIVNTRSIVDPQVGVKLSGKLGSKNLLSTLYALDEYPGTLGELPNGKKAHFSVLRYGRLLTNDSYLGGVFTGWNFDGQHNYIGGADGRLRTGNQSRVEFHGFGSFSGSEGASSSGHAVGASWHFDSRQWNFRFGGFDISNDFDTRLGYVTRTGATTFPVFAARSFYFENKTLQRISPYYWSRHSRDHAAGRWETFNVLGLELALPRQTEISVSTWLGDEIFAGQRFGRNALRLEAGAQPWNWLRAGLEWRHGQGILYDPENPLPGNETELGASIRLQPTQKIASEFSLRYAGFYKKSGHEKLYNATIWRNVTVLQFNKYLFVRAITEFNTYRKQWREDLLVSFTWIPGTVVYLGYGSQFEKQEWQGAEYVPSVHYLNSQRAWFFKASYRWQK